jgi:hypothetical protein
MDTATNYKKSVKVKGLNWFERPGKSPLWRKFLDGKSFTSAGDGSGYPTEASAKVALAEIRHKAEGTEPKVSHPKTDTTLLVEVDRFLKNQKQRYDTKEISVHAWISVKSEVERFRDWLEGKKTKEITERVLSDYRSYLMDLQQNQNTMIRNFVSAKRVVHWLWEERVIADLPRNINKVFKLSSKSKKDKVIKVFTVEQLRQLYKSADEETRLYFLLALNTGAYFADISALRHDEYDGKYVSRGRNKTGVFGHWLLWKSTKELLESQSSDKTNELMLIQDGKPLYEYKNNGKKTIVINKIKPKWTNLLKSSGLVGTFRMLRSSGATLIRQVSDKDTASQWLAHEKSTMAEKHYLADNYSKLDTALLAVENLLAFDTTFDTKT